MSHLVGLTWPDCLAWSPPDWLSHLTPSLEFLSYLSFIHLDFNVLNLQVQSGFWTLQFQLSIWVDAHFSWSKDRLENYKKKKKKIRSSLTGTIELSGAQTKPGTCRRTCGLNSQDQKTHCTGNEGLPCPYCWWNTLTPPAQGGGGEGRKKRKDGRASLVIVREKFHKHSTMSIISMDQTNWRFTTRSHSNCLAFGIIPVSQMFSYSSTLCCESLIHSPGIFLRFKHVSLSIHLLPLYCLTVWQGEPTSAGFRLSVGYIRVTSSLQYDDTISQNWSLKSVSCHVPLCEGAFYSMLKVQWHQILQKRLCNFARVGSLIPMCEISTSFHPKKEFWN